MFCLWECPASLVCSICATLMRSFQTVTREFICLPALAGLIFFFSSHLWTVPLVFNAGIWALEPGVTARGKLCQRQMWRLPIEIEFCCGLYVFSDRCIIYFLRSPRQLISSLDIAKKLIIATVRHFSRLVISKKASARRLYRGYQRRLGDIGGWSEVALHPNRWMMQERLWYLDSVNIF